MLSISPRDLALPALAVVCSGAIAPLAGGTVLLASGSIPVLARAVADEVDLQAEQVPAGRPAHSALEPGGSEEFPAAIALAESDPVEATPAEPEAGGSGISPSPRQPGLDAGRILLAQAQPAMPVAPGTPIGPGIPLAPGTPST